MFSIGANRCGNLWERLFTRVDDEERLWVMDWWEIIDAKLLHYQDKATFRKEESFADQVLFKLCINLLANALWSELNAGYNWVFHSTFSSQIEEFEVWHPFLLTNANFSSHRWCAQYQSGFGYQQWVENDVIDDIRMDSFVTASSHHFMKSHFLLDGRWTNTDGSLDCDPTSIEILW
jgi:hypothetical protein